MTAPWAVEKFYLVPKPDGSCVYRITATSAEGHLRMTWIELAQEEALKLGVALPPEVADGILWEYTGFPAFFDPEEGAEATFRRQIREEITSRLVDYRTAYPGLKGLSSFQRIDQGDFLQEDLEEDDPV